LRSLLGCTISAPGMENIEIIELPAVPEAICGVHLGAMDTIHESWQSVHEEVLARGLVATGPCREVYVRSESDDQSDWVTELQQPVSAA